VYAAWKGVLKLLKSVRSAFGLFKNLLGYRIFIVYILTLTGGLCESLGILFIIPLIMNMLNGSLNESSDNYGSLASTITDFSGWIGVERFSENGDNLFLATIVFCVLLVVLKSILLFFANIINSFFRGKLLYIIRSNILQGIFDADYSHTRTRETGYYLNLISTQVDSTLAAFKHLSLFFMQLVLASVYTFFAFLVSTNFILIGLVTIIPCVIAFMFLNSKVRWLSKEYTSSSSQTLSFVVQTLSNLSYIKSIGKLDRVQLHGQVYFKKLANLQFRLGMFSSLIIALREPIILTLVIILMYVQVQVLGASIASLMTALILLYRCFNSFINVQNSYQSFAEHLGGVEEVQDALNDLQKNKEIFVNTRTGYFRHSLEVVEVSLIENDGRVILDDISLSIPFGTCVGIAGPSGAGKSTLLLLLLGLLKPSSGDILIDGVSRRDVNLSEWRSSVGYVPQQPFLLNTTILNNITLTVEGDYLSEKNVERAHAALELVGLTELITDLYDGIHTKLGSEGVTLSGGEAQRLAIAREFYRDVDIIFLDEVTSALDKDSEEAVLQSIKALKGKITIIFTSHKPKFFEISDIIYDLEKIKYQT
jgi:ABC-type multidrug transport system fused ATPase/permease subunit